MRNFNPRSREGSDRQIFKIPRLVEDFNPRSREGSDEALALCILPGSGFQPTLPRGERRSFFLLHIFRKDNFNPRSREGSDPGINCKQWSLYNFNPRSREGSDISRGG